jgi:hypothetical protein
MRTTQPFSLFESLEGRAMFNSAPVIPDWVESSIAVTRWTAGATSWSYEEIAAAADVFDADGDSIRFFVRTTNNIPPEFGPGLVTNGGVASTVRGAHVREFAVTVLEDGCAAFTPALHATAIEALRPVASIATVAEALAEFA